MNTSAFQISNRSVRKKRVLFISQVYSPSHDATSQISADLATGLLDLGWDVHVLTNQVNYMTGERLPRHEILDGVQVWRTPCVPLRRENPLARIAIYGGFFVTSAPALALVPKPDVAIYLSTPPLVAWSGAALRALGKVKTAYWAQDVYPEAPVQMRIFKNSLLKRMLFFLDRTITRRMDEIVVIGDEMELVFDKKGILKEKITTIHNWSVVDFKSITRAKNSLLTANGLLDKFVVQYSGNMGVAHDFTPICDAMVNTAVDLDIHWLLIGEGKRKKEVADTVSMHMLSNVTMMPYQPIEELSISLTAADVALVSLRPNLEGLVVPSKLYGAMAAGLPIIFIGSPKGEVARILERHTCGLTAADGEKLVQAVRRLKDDSDLRKKMGENARAAYDAHYAREHGIRKFHELLTRMLDK